MSNVVPFPRWKRPENPNGEVYITPSATDGGSWAILHVSRSGDATALIQDGVFSFDDAEMIAAHVARERGADFREGGFAV